MSLAEKIKVLIVDDRVTSRLLLGDALQQLGFKQITAAGDGEQGARRSWPQQPHHLVISDFNMPKMDGLGLPGGRAEQSGDEEGRLHHV